MYIFLICCVFRFIVIILLFSYYPLISGIASVNKLNRKAEKPELLDVTQKTNKQTNIFS